MHNDMKYNSLSLLCLSPPVLGPGLVGAGGVLLKKIGGQIGEFATRKAGRGTGTGTSRGTVIGKIKIVEIKMVEIKMFD
jgi:hypothetical protein